MLLYKIILEKISKRNSFRTNQTSSKNFFELIRIGANTDIGLVWNNFIFEHYLDRFRFIRIYSQSLMNEYFDKKKIDRPNEFFTRERKMTYHKKSTKRI